MRKKRLMLALVGMLILALAAIWYWPSFAGTKGAEAIEKPRKVAFLQPDPTPFGEVLAALVTADGFVAYDQATEQHRQLLNKYLADVAKATPMRFASDEDRLAFYINAYNALVIDRVLELMPITSIKDAGPLHAFFRERIHMVAGARVSLHGFESKVIQKYDPLLHFGLNCASVSCPPLQKAPYRGDLLIDQLRKAAREFLANDRYNYFDKNSRTLFLSKIFDWYAGDFDGAEGLERLIADLGPDSWSEHTRIRYLPYNWSLNTPTAISGHSPLVDDDK